MKNLKNKVQLIGNLFEDPIATKVNGKKCVKACLLTTDRHTDANGNKAERTNYHKLVA